MVIITTLFNNIFTQQIHLFNLIKTLNLKHLIKIIIISMQKLE